MSKQYSILFIGNSMTYFYDMPAAIFGPMAKSVGLDLKITSITAGGRFLFEHMSLDDEPARAVSAALDPSNFGAYDFVVMQEGMPRLFTDPDGFRDDVRVMTQKIRAIGAAPALYARFGNQKGHPELPDDPDCTYEGVYNRLVEAHRAIAEELDMPVAWTVKAVHDLNEAGVDFDLYADDHSHPAYAGSYIAALTVLAAVFGVDPVSVPYDGLLMPAQAEICRLAAGKAMDPAAG